MGGRFFSGRTGGAALLALSLLGCEKILGDKKPPPVSEAPTITSVESPVPRANVELPDAANLEGRSPYEQARAYAAGGQLWMARLVLEPKALGEKGTPAELELLGTLCMQQDDAECLASCEKKLGRKIKDAGAIGPAGKKAK